MSGGGSSLNEFSQKTKRKRVASMKDPKLQEGRGRFLGRFESKRGNPIRVRGKTAFNEQNSLPGHECWGRSKNAHEIGGE